MDCLPPEVAKAIKSSFSKDVLDDLSSVKFEQLDDTLLEIVGRMDGDVEAKDLVYKGLKEEILTRQKNAIDKYINPTSKKKNSKEEVSGITKLRRTNEMVNDIMKTKPENRTRKIEEMTGMLSPKERDEVTEAILAQVDSRINKRDSAKLEKTIDNILEKYNNPKKTPKSRTKDMTELSQVNRRTELLRELSKLQPDDASQRISELVKEDVFGDNTKELQDALYAQSRQMRTDKLQKRADKILEGNKPRVSKNVPQKILDIKDFSELDANTFEGIARTKLGMDVSREQAVKLFDVSEKLQAQINPDTRKPFRDPENPYLPTKDFLSLQKELALTKLDINPTSKKEVIRSLPKGAMLARVSTQTGNIIFNLTTAIPESISRRTRSFSEFEVSGTLLKDPKKVKYEFSIKDGVPASKYGDFHNIAMENMKTFWSTSYDSARGMSLIDNKTVLGEEFFMPRNPASKVIMAGVHAMGAVDQYVATMGKLEATYSYSKRLLRENGITPKSEGYTDLINDMQQRLFTGDFTVDPENPKVTDSLVSSIDSDKLHNIKTYAEYEANLNTSQQNTQLNEMTGGIRRSINNNTPGGVAGDFFLAFVKSTSGNIMSSMKYMGANLPSEVFDSAISYKNNPTPETIRREFSNLAVQAVNPVLAFATTGLLASQIDPSTYISKYPSTERERNLMESQGRSAGTVVIGGVEVSTQFLSVLEPAFNTFMNWENNKDGVSMSIMGGDFETSNPFLTALGSYVSGAQNALFNSPLSQGIDDMAQDIGELLNSDDGIGGVATYALVTADDWVTRFIPGFIQQAGGITDLDEGAEVNRRNTRNEMFGRLRSSFPITRHMLEKKYNVYGEPVTQNFATNFLFGSRVNTVAQEAVILEHHRLQADTGISTAPTKIKDALDAPDFDFLTPEKKKELTQQYGQGLLEKERTLMTSEEYTDYMTDAERIDYVKKLQTEYRSVWKDNIKDQYEELLGDSQLIADWEEEKAQREVTEDEEKYGNKYRNQFIRDIIEWE